MAGTGTGDFAVEDDEDDVLRVKATSDPADVAAAVAHAIYDSKKVVLRAIGAGSVNQAVKAIAIARGYVAPRGIDLSVKPGFATVRGYDGGDISAITLTVLVN